MSKTKTAVLLAAAVLIAAAAVIAGFQDTGGRIFEWIGLFGRYGYAFTAAIALIGVVVLLAILSTINPGLSRLARGIAPRWITALMDGPEIVYTGQDSARADTHDGGSPPSRTGEAEFVHLKFSNAPRTGHGITAEKVIGRVSFYRDLELQECLLPERIHRWVNAPERQHHGKNADLLGQLDLEPNEFEHKLDLWMRYSGDIDCYTHTTESAMYLCDDWRDPDWKIPTGTFIARVRILGKNVRREFAFEVVNTGIETKVKLINEI